MLIALQEGKITEGHTRPLLMLKDRPEEQQTLFKEILYKKVTVRDAESIARRIAQDKIRNRNYLNDPEVIEMEGKLSESLGTRVQIDRKQNGGKITIDFFSRDDLHSIIEVLESNKRKGAQMMLEKHIAEEGGHQVVQGGNEGVASEAQASIAEQQFEPEKKEVDDDEMYSIKNFSL